LVLVPVMLRVGLHAYWPRRFRLHVARGAIHSVGTVLWFTALPHVTLAQNSAIGFTGPIFTMLGAWLFLNERMYSSRWVAVAVAFGGVLIVLWPDLTLPDGSTVYSMLLLASAPIFAVSFLYSKTLTRYDRPEAIVFWLGLFVAVFALPFAIVGFDFSAGALRLHYAWQWPTPWQWVLFVSCGITGSAAHYCMTRAFHAADVSAVYPMRFFDLVWASLFGFLAFAHVPTPWALVGGSIICAATLWIARRERLRPVPPG
jgi:drug/metabolite transporter (DMT)-like permease